MNMKDTNIDSAEIAKFDDLAADWWNPDGQSKPLHDINPLRLAYIRRRCDLAGKKVLDVGCGGGILTEALAKSGANVTGIDNAKQALSVAEAHALGVGLNIDYAQITVEQKARQDDEQYDVVCCMEMLEHVPEPESIVRACAHLVKPNGHIFFSTLNRHPKAYFFAVLTAEYVLKLLPKGTHDYQRFIRPAEMASICRQQAKLQVLDITGMSYNPLSKKYTLGQDVHVNYLMYCQKLTVL